jgi:hypothetical protein
MMRAIPRTINMRSRPSGGLASCPTDATRATPLSTSVAPHDRAAGFPGGHHRFCFPWRPSHKPAALCRRHKCHWGPEDATSWEDVWPPRKQSRIRFALASSTATVLAAQTISGALGLCDGLHAMRQRDRGGRLRRQQPRAPWLCGDQSTGIEAARAAYSAPMQHADATGGSAGLGFGDADGSAGDRVVAIAIVPYVLGSEMKAVARSAGVCAVGKTCSRVRLWSGLRDTATSAPDAPR